MRVTIAGQGSGLRVSPPETLFQSRFTNSIVSNWTLSRDGTRILAAMPLETDAAPPLILVSNWADELE
jgi:hypothetical protein